MSLTRINATAATLTKNRTEDSIVSLSGMCTTCVDGCIGMCEIGKSAYRGSETLYPQPFGIITTACQKNFPVDYSHFTVMSGVVGAKGIEADSDKAIFANVNLEVKIGHDKGIKFCYPWIIPGIGSTNIAKNNWEGIAIGSALSGTGLTIGENVVGMDTDAIIKNGRVIDTVDLKNRIKLYKDYQTDGYGTVIVQANVEDTRLGVHEYAIEKLGVEMVEMKWGQGAKNIGGEVKIKDLKRAQEQYKRGYIVIPNPTNPEVIRSYEKGVFTEFERHSRMGMVTEEGFARRVEQLRKAGAKYIALKTGAYSPATLALSLKLCSRYKVDYLTVDGAGGGTGMSPWRMMNEWGIPPVELHSLTYQYAKRLAGKGHYVPAIAFAGGFILEDQIFKGLALGAPFVKLIGMARGPIAAAMVGKTIGNSVKAHQIPVYVERFGSTIDEIFITSDSLREKLGNDEFDKLPAGAIGLYTYYERLAKGLRQLMCGARIFGTEHFSRRCISSLTKECAEISRIPYIMEYEKEEAEKILNSE